MGMHFGLIAVKGSVTELREMFLEVWPKFQLVSMKAGLPNADAAWAWKKSHSEFVSAADWSKDNRGKEVFLFWQDGPWAVMDDDSYVHASDAEALKALSQKLGRVLSFCVETAGGCASFACYDNGELRREIAYTDGDTSLKGEPLPEEAGIDVNFYYMDETEQLMEAFGLSSLQQIRQKDAYHALCVVDQTDYEKEFPENPFVSREPATRTADSTNRTVVQLTTAAVKKLQEMPSRDEKPFLRVSVKSGSTGFQYDLKFDDHVNEGNDYLDSSGEIKVVVDKTSALFLEGVTIDWKTLADGRQGFHFNNPNAIEPEPLPARTRPWWRLWG